MKKITLFLMPFAFSLSFSNPSVALTSKLPDLFVAEIIPYTTSTDADGNSQSNPDKTGTVSVPPLLIDNNNITTNEGVRAEILTPNTNIFSMTPTDKLNTFGSAKLRYVDSADAASYCDVIINEPVRITDKWFSKTRTEYPSINYECYGNLRYSGKHDESNEYYDFMYVIEFRNDKPPHPLPAKGRDGTLAFTTNALPL